MKIHLDFDERLLIKQIQHESPLLFGIAWENDGVYYPARDWIDFGIVIIGWWFHIAVKDPEELADAELKFMDGPYSIKVSYDKQKNMLKYEPGGLNIVWLTSVEEFSKELIYATSKIIEKLSEMNIDNKSLDALKKAIYLLESLNS